MEREIQNGPLEIYRHYMCLLPGLLRRFLFPIPLNPSAPLVLLLLTIKLPHRKRKLCSVRSANAFLAPRHRVARGGVVGDAFGAGERRHRRHVKDFVLEEDQHGAFVDIEGED